MMAMKPSGRTRMIWPLWTLDMTRRRIASVGRSVGRLVTEGDTKRMTKGATPDEPPTVIVYML